MAEDNVFAAANAEGDVVSYTQMQRSVRLLQVWNGTTGRSDVLM